MPVSKVVMKTVHGHSNYATGGINIEFDELDYVEDAALLQVGSNITGVMTVQAASQTLSGQVAEGVNSSGNIATALLNQTTLVSGMIELADATSLSGITLVAMARGY
jgi:hypothetical protein